MTTTHGTLRGGSGSGVRFRPPRLSGADLPAGLLCLFRSDGVELGPWPVLDLGEVGFALAASQDHGLTPGSTLDGVQLALGERTIWLGAATVVYVTPGRLGARFAGALLDVRQLRLEATLEARMGVLREQRELLPAPWRAAVGDLRRLLEDVKLEVQQVELTEHYDPLRRGEEEDELFERLRARWGPTYYSALVDLGRQSAALHGRARTLARSYASAVLMPLLRACPIHRRAHDKPLGYAGDFRMMELHFARERTGEGLFGRFLQSIAQNYTLGRAVVAREALMRDAIREVLLAPVATPARVLSLAAGPAIELGRVLEADAVRRPTELILLDQDRNAHENAHRRLARVLNVRHGGALPVSLTCLHFSVRQVLRPQGPDERVVVDTVLADLDLIYCAGLYDYLSDAVARRLTHAAYSRLRPGGRLLLGNLVEAPDCTFMMDFVLDWPLHYRRDETLLALAADLSPTPARVSIARDATGHAIFLDVVRPS
jgi:extracellular factor (EF) 3-hydroxypalmitic acid methyl ester biosynthesis protein